MGVVAPIDQPFALQTRKKVGNSLDYGQKIYTQFRYGREEPILGPAQYGWADFGKERFGNASSRWGIYQVRRQRGSFLSAGEKETGKQVVIKKGWYHPANPQTESQQANRSKYADAIVAWQGLTSSQKDVYNQRAKYKPYSGYNLYLKEYLLSH